MRQRKDRDRNKTGNSAEATSSGNKLNEGFEKFGVREQGADIHSAQYTSTIGHLLERGSKDQVSRCSAYLDRLRRTCAYFSSS